MTHNGFVHGTDGHYRWFVAACLSLAYAVAFIDRQVFNLLIDPIKHTLQFSDTQISLLQGSAFVIAYMAMGPLFGRAADSLNRRNVILFGIIAWCGSTVLCGMSNGFGSMLVARAGVGGAEACLLPASMSILADYFEREKLPRAVSILLLGTFIGGGLALVFGGLLMKVLGNSDWPALFHRDPWQLTFMAVGLPGLAIAALMFTVQEPARKGSKSSDRIRTRDVVSFLWAERVFYTRFFCAVSLLFVGLYALPAWTPAMLMRLFAATPQKVGVEYGTATLIAAAAGVLTGPALARLLARRSSTSAPLYAAMISGGLAAAASLFVAHAPTYWSALIASAMGSFSLNLAAPLTGAALQAATPNRMRGVLTSAYAITLMTLGVGIAPTLIALLTEHVYADPARLGTSLAWVSGIPAIVSVPLLAAAVRPYRSRIAAMSDPPSPDSPGGAHAQGLSGDWQNGRYRDHAPSR